MSVSITDPSMSGVWEPWAPHIGQRVRVQSSGECRTCCNVMVVNGVTGTVIEQPPPFADYLDLYPDHPYAVLFDKPVYDATYRQNFLGGNYAACELEPIENG